MHHLAIIYAMYFFYGIVAFYGSNVLVLSAQPYWDFLAYCCLEEALAWGQTVQICIKCRNAFTT